MAETDIETGTEVDPGESVLERPLRPLAGVRWLTDDEAHAIFDAEARKVMGMSGEEFLRRYGAGEFDDMPDDWDHMDYWSLVLSIPFGR